MSSEFNEFVRSGFRESARVVSSQDDGADLIIFDGRSAEIIKGPVAEAQEMKAAGIDPVADEQCVLLAEDFETLGATYESEVELGDRTLRLTSIQRAGALVVIGLKALR